MNPYHNNQRPQFPQNDMFQHRHQFRQPWGQAQGGPRGQFQGHRNRFFRPQGPHYAVPESGNSFQQPGFPHQNAATRELNNGRNHPHHQNNNYGHQQRNFNPQNQWNQKKNKKKRPDKRERPENNIFFCDTCDRGFATEEKYQEHVDSHEKCSDPNCSYIAAPKLIRLHYQMQHRTGLARKIWQLDSQEDIDRWKAERRKNFPTAANIARKKAVAAEKRSRGEKLDTKYFGKMKGKHQHGQRNPQNRKRKFDDQVGDEEHGSLVKKADNSLRRDDANTTLEDPLLAVLHNSMPAEKAEKSTPVDDTSVAGGLASIISSYGADSDNDSAPDESPTKPGSSSPSKPSAAKLPVTCPGRPAASKPASTKPKRKQKKELIRNSDIMRRNRPTLLERLLASEIRHERNVLLQCVHYIVRKNFFDSNNNCKAMTGS